MVEETISVRSLSNEKWRLVGGFQVRKVRGCHSRTGEAGSPARIGRRGSGLLTMRGRQAIDAVRLAGRPLRRRSRLWTPRCEADRSGRLACLSPGTDDLTAERVGSEMKCGCTRSVYGSVHQESQLVRCRLSRLPRWAAKPNCGRRKERLGARQGPDIGIGA